MSRKGLPPGKLPKTASTRLPDTVQFGSTQNEAISQSSSAGLLLDRALRAVLTRYLMASIFALAVDFAVFISLVNLAVVPGPASGIGYCAGIFVHWAISVRFVFTGKRRDGLALHGQRVLFIGSAMLGLALTMGVVSIATIVGIAPVVAKALAAIISFFSVFLIRKYGVFR